MIRKASFQNFKALAAVEVPLSRFTVIVGKNGSGKTSVLQGMHYASQVGLRRKDEEKNASVRLGMLFSGSRSPTRLVTARARGPMRLALSDTNGATLTIEARLPADEDAPCQFAVTVAGVDEASSGSIELPTDDAREATKFLDAPLVRRFASTVYLHLDAERMAHASVAASSEPRLEHDGERLPSVLSYLAGAEPETLDAITEDLAKVVPQVRGVRTLPVPVTRRSRERIVIGDQVVNRPVEEQVPGVRFALDMGGGRLIPADLLSEGTVLALGLLTVLRLPKCPRLVLMDDIDGALHAEAQAELVRCIRSILDARSDVQVVCTSHSPYLLDHVELDEVRVMALDREGHARCRALNEHPQADRWRNMLRTGEFWASVGEEWLLEGAADER
ncbi:AAA family ATPase [Sorangium sp. So ce131]|uniref:AAA family ATPase n=1 Tax=Sorangium sp. So ce131 TaxID=3133282 RepID=UPI003F630228